MDIIEANECLRAWFGRPKKGTFEDKDIGKEEGEIWEELEEQDGPIGGGNSDEDGGIIAVDQVVVRGEERSLTKQFD